ncbi:recombinase family protein [Streptomyces violaceusniger]|uniref:Resolvase domain-containing protein n=1 Tax=Streptomyces violaceusniger (strain Tu 4113) TaxID=653045 RepID=G2PBS0_STRV4|nr:recombinase family protein [Streptomyces violaceusniger]AEM80992.1 Resolvase domain-containing protein [Streptomyces violaceusniger Tu 4113]
MAIRAAIYVRISQDRGGAGLGIARQEEDCRALCSRKGWDVVDVYPDNDVSAYSGAPRPKWQELLEDINEGVINAVVCWHVDRLTRSPRELEDVIDLADRHGLELATVSGEIDLATPTGRMIARMLGAAARHEAEHKAERQQRQRRQAAEAGKVAGGGKRPFGYEDDRITVRESEAEIIREGARRVLAGESLASICRDWKGREIVTAAGIPWKPSGLRRMLASARISGRREHTPRRSWESTRPLLGEIVGDAVWPGTISHEDSDRLRALLSDPDRRRTNDGGNRSYLLSGILRCGKPTGEPGKACGWGMVGRPRSGVPRYVCPNTPGTNACGGTAANAERTDDQIRDMVLAAFESPTFMKRLREPDEDGSGLYEKVRADEEELEELAQDYGNQAISRKEWMVARAPIQERLERNRARLAKVSRKAVLLGFVGSYEDMLSRWKKMNDSQRRAVITAAVRSIEVLPANPRKRWDPDRFVIDWIA